MRNRIRELRTERGLRQKDLAAQLGISAQSLGYYENWVNKPDPEMLVKIADFFNVSIDYVLGREDEYGNISVGQQEILGRDELKLLEDYRKLPDSLKKVARLTLSCWANHDE